MEKVKLGVIGCGWCARDLYGPFFRYLENGVLAGAMDIDRERVREYQRLTNCKKVYTDLAPMLEDKEIDAVLILTPTNLHAEQVVKAAEAKKHIYCEKPMAKTVEEADKMISACRQNKVKLQVAFMKRFNKSYQLVKKAIEEGRLGDIFELRAIWDNARAGATAENCRFQLTTGGGYLQEDGSHPVDLCHWWMGEVEEVSAEVMMVDSKRRENDDVALVVMKHKNGALSSLHITMLTHRIGKESYEVFGTKGTLLMRWLYHSTRSLEPAIIRLYEKGEKVTDLTLPASWNPQKELEDNWQYLEELRHFCDCILKNKEPRVTGSDGKAAVEIINAAYLSSWEGRKVKLPLKKSPDLNKIFTELKDQSKWNIEEEDLWGQRWY